MRLYTIDDRFIIEYRAGGGMKIGRRCWSTRRLPALVSLCPPRIVYQLTWEDDDQPSELWHGMVGGLLEKESIYISTEFIKYLYSKSNYNLLPMRFSLALIKLSFNLNFTSSRKSKIVITLNCDATRIDPCDIIGYIEDITSDRFLLDALTF
jgi:hypothetical protein